jgi:hypothetical protein
LRESIYPAFARVLRGRYKLRRSDLRKVNDARGRLTQRGKEQLNCTPGVPGLTRDLVRPRDYPRNGPKNSRTWRGYAHGVYVLWRMTSEELRIIKAGPQAATQVEMLTTLLLTDADDSDTAVLGFVFAVEINDDAG